MTGSAEVDHMEAQKLYSILLHRLIAKLKNYPCTVSLLAWLAFLEGILLTTLKRCKENGAYRHHKLDGYEL